MPTPYEKLSTLLKELFQLDQADLDFGIYRILNQKRDEISRFLDAELLPQVKTAFEQYRPADKKVLEEKIEQAKHAAFVAGFSPEQAEQAPKVKELRDQQATYSVDTNGLENEVYSHLYSFFRRYYDNGDFISMRRYKEGVYAIPYEGEEVKLHWANADQYYVKTTENFRDYSFRLPSGRLAHFKIVEAETEKDNVKSAEEKNRRFILVEGTSHKVHEETPGESRRNFEPLSVHSGLAGDEFEIRFEYRTDPAKRDQKTLNALAAETILAGAPAAWVADLKTPAPTESNPKRTLLEKHLADYTARNTFDYFIHKDLRGFLKRELDFYIKNEVMHLDDIEDEDAPQVEQYLSKIKVIRQIAHKIIEFLAQIEDFQKKLWLKKKFVVETNYCITLDRVPEELYPEICANAAQREEWVRLFAIDEITGEQPAQPELSATPKPGYSVPLTVEFLKANPFLVLDTNLFDQKFFFRLLSSIENLDENLDGLLIRSENFQALNVLQKKFVNQIKCTYIDPPYNTGEDGFTYKDNYQYSSWLSMMESRLNITYPLLKQDGIFLCSIDDYEINRLSLLLRQLWGQESWLATFIRKRRTTSAMSQNLISQDHEYV
ncbi:MAG: DNA methyltransferase, partial [Smithella sp.]